jgi:hypothetical protein
VIDLILDFDKDALIMDSTCSFDVATTKIPEPTISDNEFVLSSILVELGSVGGSISTQATIPEVINTLDADIIVNDVHSADQQGASNVATLTECGSYSYVLLAEGIQSSGKQKKI